MPVVETAATALGKAVATYAATQWLAARRNRADSARRLSELVAVSFPDRLLRRKVELQFESVAEDIAARVERLFEADGTSIPEHELAAALDAVAATFGPAAFSDEALFAVDADADALVARLQPNLASAAAAAGLSDAAERLAGRVLEDCVHCYVQMVRHLPEFTNRASQETLARLSRISIDLAELLSRLPVARTTDAPADDDTFLNRYLRFIATHYDQLELFGVDVRNYTPETTLSIAYLSLAVSGADGSAPARQRLHRPGPAGHGAFSRSSKERAVEEHTGLRVETALGLSQRILIRGEAGSGKSTLLRWLVINAARETFTGDLHPWNGRVPFLVKLRSYANRPLPPVGRLLGDDVAEIAAGAPAGLVERIFTAGRALLLVDGVDELVRTQRTAVRQWLRRILDQHPDVIVVVTSRPTAAPARWLTNEGFTAVVLERMTPADIVLFVGRWHRAIAGARYLPCNPADLPRFERRLLARLDANHHLRGLATNPLMCAMLCALNLDRGDDLPHDRISLYRAALEMLLERRDTARNVPAYRRVALGAQHAMSLLQDLAWRLTQANHAELHTAQARTHVTRKLATMPKVTADADDVFEHLLDRSGVLKDVTEDRISFVHRTFQEYLTAKEIAEEDYIDVLVAHATRDMWRETVIMTAGLASSEYRQRLINGLLDRAESSPPKARWLRLLAGACVETAPAVAVGTLDRIDANLAQLIPPRSAVEARSLALAGERVLRFLPDDLDALSEAAAAAVVKTAAFIGGPRALDKLSRYGRDARRRVVQALIQAANHFEPDEYGRRVLAESPLTDGWMEADEWTAPMLRHLRNLRGIWLDASPTAEIMRHVPTVRAFHVGLSLFAGDDLDLGFLRDQTELETLMVFHPSDPTTLPERLARLTNLRLSVGRDRAASDLGWLTRFPRIRSLELYDLPRKPRTFRPLAGLPELNELVLNSASRRSNVLADTSFLRYLPPLTRLGLNDCTDPRVLEQIAAHQGNLPALQLMRLKAPELDLRTVAGLPLETLDLDGFEGPMDLTPLANHPTLSYLDLRNCPGLSDLSPLSSLPELRDLYLYGVPDLDLSPLAGNRRLTVWANSTQRFRNAGGIRIKR